MAATKFTTRDAAFLAATMSPNPPPAGVTPNFDKHNVNSPIFIVISLVMMLLALIFTIIRIYTKAILTRALGWDDHTCVLALNGAFIWTGVNIKMAIIGMGRHLYETFTTYANAEAYLKDAFIVNTTYIIVICLIKMSILLLYLRTFAIDRNFRWTTWIVIFITVASHFVCWILLWAEASPLKCHWVLYPTKDLSRANCTFHFDGEFNKIYLVFIAALNVVLDIIVLAIPCPHVWRLHIPKKEKIMIMIILLTGLIVTIASILRLVYLIRRFYYVEDRSFTEFQVNLASTVEIDLAIICACLPTLRAFLNRFFPHLFKSSSSSNKPTLYGPRSIKRTANPPSSSTVPPGKADSRWANGSHEETLVGGTYVELGEDGKSDQSIGMTDLASSRRSGS